MNIYEAANILEVSTNISKEELKKKFKELVLKYHPDRNKDFDSTQKFIDIKEAYETLFKSEPFVPIHYADLNNGFYSTNPYATQGTSGSWSFTFTTTTY